MRILISILSILFIASCSDPKDSYLGFWVPDSADNSFEILITKDKNDQLQVITGNNIGDYYTEFNDDRLFLVAGNGYPKVEIVRIDNNQIQFRGKYLYKYFVDCQDLQKKVDGFNFELYKKFINSNGNGLSVEDNNRVFEEIITKLSPLANSMKTPKERLYYLRNSVSRYYSSKKDFENQHKEIDEYFNFTYSMAIYEWLNSYYYTAYGYESLLGKINQSCNVSDALRQKIYNR